MNFVESTREGAATLSKVVSVKYHFNRQCQPWRKLSSLARLEKNVFQLYGAAADGSGRDGLQRNPKCIIN